MDFDIYQQQAARTLNQAAIDKKTLLHVAALGLASEVGEICSEIKKAVEQQRDIDVAKIHEEAGDSLWYLSAILTLLDMRLELAAIGNIEKLRRRYPDGFSAAASIARRDKAGYPCGGTTTHILREESK